jgi:hypothetical protein
MADCTVETQQHFAFDTITVPAGDSVVADQANDTLDLATGSAGLTITGDATNDRVTFDTVPTAGVLGDVIGPGPTVLDEALAVFDGTGGYTIKAHPAIKATAPSGVDTIEGVQELQAQGTTFGFLNALGQKMGEWRGISGTVNYARLLGGTSGNPVIIGVLGETNIDLTITSKGSGDVIIESGTGDVRVTEGELAVEAGDIVFTERADHSSTPGAGFGYLWTKNTAPSTLIFTDDTGVDTTLGVENEAHLPFFAVATAVAIT